jgi:hypothetical protein
MVKRSPEEILQAIEDAPLEDELDAEAERILAMTPEERRRELEAAGVDLGEVEAAADAVHARMQGGVSEPPFEPRRAAEAPVVPIAHARRRHRSAWLAMAAAVVLLIGALGATEGGAIVAWFKAAPELIQPDNERPKPFTPRELAGKARDEAEQACASELWGLCGDKLDEASQLDPAGDSEARVKQLRQAIVDHTTFNPRLMNKGKDK